MMKKIDQFDVSDLAARSNPGWRVRWGAAGSDATLLVDLNTTKDESKWKLVSTVPGTEINLKNDQFFAEPMSSVRCATRTVRAEDIESGNLPSILRRCVCDHFNDIPAPRHINSKPVMSKEEAQALEQEFYEKMIAPYLDSHLVYAVSKSGVELAKRLGIRSFWIINVKHYEGNTFQNDSGIEIGEIFIPEADKPVLVIDDMVSSGRTANAIIKQFELQGVTQLRYAALFNILASREIEEVNSYIETQMTISNFYWLYGRGMDLFEEESRKSKSIYGADKAFGDETKEDIDALFDFFNE